MRTVESVRAARLFGGSPAEQTGSDPSALGSFILSKMRVAREEWPLLSTKEATVRDRELMSLALKNGEETEIQPIGKGIHRPYRVTFSRGIDIGSVTTRQAVMKTVYCQFEKKRYCQCVDLSITGPERELLSYDLDKVLGFDLVPPVVGREIARMGFGSLQAWVNEPTAWEWNAKGYDYRKDLKNPWLHRLAAFDFLRGEIDRHANNWLMDPSKRVYAIDNGYSFVKADDRKWFRSSAGKCLKGIPLHPVVGEEISSIDEQAVWKTLQDRGFKSNEDDGVLKRLRQLKRLGVWEKLGDLW